MRSLLVCSVFVAGTVLLWGPKAMGQSPQASSASVTGELQQWHKITLTVDGPSASEGGTPNPFLDYRMQVTFRHPKTGLTYQVPGYFAADGNAANSSATSGNKWRAHLSPDHTGEWTYEVSFRRGKEVAVSDDPLEGTTVEGVDGTKGTFQIKPSDKTGRDFRGKGRLQYVGKHHLRFAGTGDYFLKAGVDAPENFLAYRDFDGDFKSDGVKDELVKTWQPHVRDWQAGDPTWQGDKGKGMIGAINYLSSQGLNAFSFLTMNIEGDDRNAFPYTKYDERRRIDCSRMDQWEVVFSHGTKMGMYLHFKTQEAENVNLLDDGATGPERRLYYRELIARFGHHLALNWNLGEEVGLGHKVSFEKKQAWANYFRDHDPYHHHIVIHNGNNHYDLMGDASPLTGFSLQTNRADFRTVHDRTVDYIRRSVKAGKPWVVACDEPGDARHSLITDAENASHDNARRNALWGNLMAGGAGVEWYFGYSHPHSDLTCQDYRVRQNMWKQCQIALNCFSDHKIPFWEMTNSDNLLSNKECFCLSKAGELYLVFQKPASETTIDLSEAEGIFEVKWFNPRQGGSLQTGTTGAVIAGGKVSIGNPPDTTDQDWLALLRPGDPNRDYAPGVSAPPKLEVMLPRSGKMVTVQLDGAAQDDRTATSQLSVEWTKVDGPGNVVFKNANATKSSATFDAAGVYQLKLSAGDGSNISEATTIVHVQPFRTLVTATLRPISDVYTENGNAMSNQFLKIEGKRRLSYLKFDLRGLPPNIIDAKLLLSVNGDSGGGRLRIHKGWPTDWTSTTMTKANLPRTGRLLVEQEVNTGSSDVLSIPAMPLIDGIGDEDYTFVLTLDEGGDDIWFGSTRSKSGPQLQITFDDPDGTHREFGKSTSAKESGSTKTNDDESWRLVFADDFDARAQLGDGYVVNEQSQAGWKVADGLLVAKQVRDDHGTVLRRMLDFGDMQFEFSFRFTEAKSADRFNVVFDDSNDSTVHAGHISRVSVSRRAVKLSDDKNGSMNNQVRELRKLHAPTKVQQHELERRLEGTVLEIPAKLDDTQWHRMKIVVQGSKKSVTLDGKAIGTLDSPGIDHPSRDKFGFTVAGKNAVEFDNWKVLVPTN